MTPYPCHAPAPCCPVGREGGSSSTTSWRTSRQGSLGKPNAPPPHARYVPAVVLSCRVRRKAALRWRLRSSRATELPEPRTFRLRVAATGGAATVPSSATELAEGGSGETPSGAPSSVAESARGGSRGAPAGAGAPGIGSTAPPVACWRACSRKAVMGDTIGGGRCDAAGVPREG